MGSNNVKCTICNTEIAKPQILTHQRECMSEELKRQESTKPCQVCKLSFPPNEYDDHIYCHTLEAENNVNQNNQVTINYFRNSTVNN